VCVLDYVFAMKSKRSAGFRSKKNSNAIQRNWTLPNSMPFMARGITRGDINVTSVILTKTVSRANLCPDISGSGIRNVVFDHFVFRFTPPTSAFPLNLANVFTAQVMALAVSGATVPVSGVCVLSMTNPRTLRVRIPEWLIFPDDPQLGAAFMTIVWRTSNNVITSAVSVAVEIEARGRLTNMEVNNF
jgi:hypothetical protein